MKNLVIFLSLFAIVSCSSKEKKEEKPAAPAAVKFSDVQNYGAISQRQYKRTTRQMIEDDSELGSQAGSLWQMEGQSAYLFAQNKTRRDGDVLKVKIEGPAQKQIETKVSVIRKLLKRIEDQQKLQQQQLLQQRGLASNDPNAPPDPAAAAAQAAVAAPPPAKPGDKKDEEQIDVNSVPTRIVERMPDGNLRVKGHQPFMIGKREYKVIVTGIVRPEDFNDDGTSSDKLIDPQFDVVSLKRSVQ